MVKWLSLIGHSESELDSLNAIHVAGTNGKGSTCAFAFSFLKAQSARTGFPRKIGLYTSPHIRNIRERVRIDGEPISEECFTIRFFEIWARLPSQPTSTLDIPRYLQLLALLAFHVFIEENVDVAIIETHLGGEWDATNIIRSPTAVGITSIAEDHIHLLGPTIEDIAWHKSGIMKPGTSAFSSIQTTKVASVLQQRAYDKEVYLEFVGIDVALPEKASSRSPKDELLFSSYACSILVATQVSPFARVGGGCRHSRRGAVSMARTVSTIK